MEIEILRWVDATFHSQGWLNYIMKYITYLGEFGAVPIACALILFIFKKTRAAGFAAGVGLIMNVLLVNVILKLAVNRARPWTEFQEITTFYEAFGIRLPTDSSFPSGHTAACCCLAATMVARFKLKGLPAAVIAALVAISRIYLCVHYPTDVLAGAAIGIACGIAGYYLSKPIWKFLEEKLFKRKPENAGGEDGEAKEDGDGQDVDKL